MTPSPKAVKRTVRIVPFLAKLRTYWQAMIAAFVGFKAKNYGTCSRVDHDELKSLARYYSRFQA